MPTTSQDVPQEVTTKVEHKIAELFQQIEDQTNRPYSLMLNSLYSLQQVFSGLGDAAGEEIKETFRNSIDDVTLHTLACWADLYLESYMPNFKTMPDEEKLEARNTFCEGVCTNLQVIAVTVQKTVDSLMKEYEESLREKRKEKVVPIKHLH